MQIYVDVYGCTANKSDANIIRGLIDKNPSFHLTLEKDQADVFVVLTCTVIDTTEQRLLHKIQAMYETKKTLIISGCMASVQAEKLHRLFPQALLLPPQYIHHLFQLIEDKNLNKQNGEKQCYAKKFIGSTAEISIAEGCQYACTYCITHLARGLLHSYSPHCIYADVVSALKQSCVEIQVTAQDTASYGFDIDSSLSELLSSLVTIPGNYRIRVGMMHPRNVLIQSPLLFRIFSNKHIYKFMHLPVQSGSDRILHLMGRGYTAAEFCGLISQIRTYFPTITIATDIIVGFPSESKEEYQESIDLIEQLKPDIVNITRFSARPFTKAKQMKGRVPTSIVKKRSQFLTKVTHRISLQKNKEYIGKTESILIIKKGKDNTMMGRTNTYKPVVIHKQVPPGSRLMVTIIDANETYLVGKIK